MRRLPGGLLAIAALVTIAVGAPALADTAQENYTAYCQKCHGPQGHGDGPQAGTLATKPQDFADCAVMQKLSDDTMFKAIKDGGAAVGLPGDMPSWSSGLSDDEIHALVQFVRAFCKK
ncbi:MAG TPA: cytochrome c [Candidatus Binataceae bacterium]|jgi:mono/diheme cytochrome c family protein|nr:cytochrome c [Candidatus Binataceae bacterium]